MIVEERTLKIFGQMKAHDSKGEYDYVVIMRKERWGDRKESGCMPMQPPKQPGCVPATVMECVSGGLLLSYVSHQTS